MPFQQKPANLRPLPMRITPLQYDRLQAHRNRDQISIQEHVRRALDNYLELLDRRAMRQNDPIQLPQTGVLETPVFHPAPSHPTDEPDQVLAPPETRSRTTKTKPKLVMR